MKKKKDLKKHGSLDMDDIACIIEEQILSLRNRIRTGRVRNPKNEEIRIKNLRTLGFLANVLKDLRQQQKLERIEEEIEMLLRLYEELKHEKVQKV